MSLYDVLGVAPSADAATVRRAYVALALRHHPDVPGGDDATMRAVNEAWATLGDADRRARYDRTFRPPAAPSAAPEADPHWIDDLHDVDDDDRAVRATIRLPGWLSLVPVALFASALLTGFFAMLFGSGAVLGLALMQFILSCLFFLAAPFIALFASRSGGVANRSQQ